MNGAPLEPVTRRFVAALMAAGGPPIYTLSPADARALLLASNQSLPRSPMHINRPSGVRRGANITRTAILVAMPVSFSQRSR